MIKKRIYKVVSLTILLAIMLTLCVACIPTTANDSPESLYSNGKAVVTTDDTRLNSEIPSQTGKNGKFLTTDGTDLAWDSPYLISTSGGWTISTSGTGSAEQSPSRLATYTGATTISATVVGTFPMSLSSSAQVINWNSSFKFIVPYYSIYTVDAPNENNWISFEQRISFACADLANNGVGIKIKYKDASHYREVYICSYDGSYSEYDTGITISSGVLYRLEFYYNAGTNIVLKLNGTTVGTKTDHLPSGTGGDSRFFIMSNRTGGASTAAYDGSRISFPILSGAY